MNTQAYTVTGNQRCPRCGKPRWVSDWASTATPDLCQCFDPANQIPVNPLPVIQQFLPISVEAIADAVARKMHDRMNNRSVEPCCVCGKREEYPNGVVMPYGSQEGDAEYVCGSCLCKALDPVIGRAKAKRKAARQ